VAGNGEVAGGEIAAAVETTLDRAARAQDLGAFWALDREGALAQAVALDDRAGGPAPPLSGATVAVKDLFDVAGLPTTGGLAAEEEPARSDAELVRRLRRAGAVPIGKTAMDPLGLTTGGQAPGFPPCRNPVDPALSPGGSSSGSAVAVAAGLTSLGLGSDTAGSVRIPAAYCGVAALKPPSRRLPRSGMLTPMGPWDLPGVIAPTFAACVAAYEAMAQRPVGSPREGRLRVGVLTDLLEAADPAVAAACERAASGLGPGFECERVEIGWDAKGFGLVLACAFERGWGERVDDEPARFPPLAREMVASAREAGAVGAASLAAAQRRRRAAIGRRLARFDAVLCPTVPVPAPDRDDEDVAVSTRFARIFSALGWPAASLPAGAAEGRPIGAQVAARPSRVAELVAVARSVEASLTATGAATVGKPAARRA
jgi:aspartyl-tRNA(Asn)/glutamyl-tRNA(Gln) amidotransferase subunit A